MKILVVIDKPIRIIDGKRFLVTQNIWADGKSNYDVSLVDDPVGGPGQLLTEESLGEEPSDDEIRAVYVMFLADQSP